MAKPVVILGHGGHARVVLDVLRLLGREIAGVLTPDLPPGARWFEIPVLGDDSWLGCAEADGYAYVLGIGALPHRPGVRTRLFCQLHARGFDLPALVHPSAVVAADVPMGQGVQIMAGAVVQPGCEIGDDALLNTRVSVDHHCRIGAHAHLAPGALLCGEVRVGEGAFIGAGAVIIQGLSVGPGAQVAAGATVIRHIAAGIRHIPGHPPIAIEQQHSGVRA
ncbi:MAG TPA: acetyltransferase [Halothiobacillus sp.]|nr:acetyltransferase [Halothiobacillus sp.]